MEEEEVTPEVFKKIVEEMQQEKKLKETPSYICCEECDRRAENRYYKFEQNKQLAHEYAAERHKGDVINGEAFVLSLSINPYEENTTEWIEKNKQIKKFWEEYNENYKKTMEGFMTTLEKDCLESIRKNNNQ